MLWLEVRFGLSVAFRSFRRHVTPYRMRASGPLSWNLFKAVIAAGSHLFPSRTEKLSPLAPMVLHTRGRVGSRHFFRESPDVRKDAGASSWGGRSGYERMRRERGGKRRRAVGKRIEKAGGEKEREGWRRCFEMSIFRYFVISIFRYFDIPIFRKAVILIVLYFEILH